LIFCNQEDAILRRKIVNNKTRILIVDDSLSFRKGIRALLSIQSDMEVIGEASDGSTAMEMIPRLKPELVLLDECMQGMSGSEVTRRIKNLWPHIKVILLTMYFDQESLAIECGVDAFLIKGRPSEHILAMIREVVEKAGQKGKIR
jgi:DNA-binding NarL/FixJ family response regulator